MTRRRPAVSGLADGEALPLALDAPPVPQATKLDHSGHRERLRTRFLEGGADALPDYELLELLLMQAIPRQDVKPLAKRLLAGFGSFANVVAAERDRLKAVDGMGDAAVAALKVTQAAALRLGRLELAGRDVLGTFAAVERYLIAAMARESIEQFRVLYLDRKNGLLKDEVQQRGTVDHTPVYTREVVKRALELGATALILAHNHPSGDPTPSRADIDMTREVMRAVATIGVQVHDHVVVARHGTASLRALGHMNG